MNKYQSQKGFTLVLGLVILIAMTYVVVSAVNINIVDFKIANNVESKEMLRLSAEQAIEQVLNNIASFSTPTQQTLTVNGYEIAVSAPECLNSVPVSGSSAVASLTPEITDWKFSATATDADTGAQVTLHQGVKIKLLSDSCP